MCVRGLVPGDEERLGAWEGYIYNQRRMRAIVNLRVALGISLLLAASKAGAGPEAKSKYYFNVIEVRSAIPLDDTTKAAAREVLEKDLAGRPEFTSSLGEATGDEVAAELKRRKLQGFNVTLKFESLKRELKPPRPGGRLKQLAIDLRLSVFGTTIPDAKLAFGGDGQAGIEAEVVERRMEQESASITHDVMVQAVKQAVDQAVAKLSMPRTQPINEGKRRKKS
jgi:hypothetical protein